MRGNSDLSRSKRQRPPKRRFYLFTEGKKTEPEYFKALERTLGGALIELEITEAAGVPATIAGKACDKAKSLSKRGRKRSSFEENDEVWAVFDKDSHPKVEDSIKMCEQRSVGVAFSNPCFELWLLLHVKEYHSPGGRAAVQRALEGECPEYKKSKGKTVNSVELLKFLETAESRAEVQLRSRMEEGDPPREPFTTVFRLTKKIRSASIESIG